MEDKKTRTTKKIDLLTSVESIVYLAKGSKLNKEFYRKADKYLKYMSEKLELTKEESVISGDLFKRKVILARFLKSIVISRVFLEGFPMGEYLISTPFVNPCIIDDLTGLSDLEIELIDGFMAATFPRGCSIDWDSCEQPRFSNTPEFGQPCEVYDAMMYGY